MPQFRTTQRDYTVIFLFVNASYWGQPCSCYWVYIISQGRLPCLIATTLGSGKGGCKAPPHTGERQDAARADAQARFIKAALFRASSAAQSAKPPPQGRYLLTRAWRPERQLAPASSCPRNRAAEPGSRARKKDVTRSPS